jgi:hypothetical protein
MPWHQGLTVVAIGGLVFLGSGTAAARMTQSVPNRTTAARASQPPPNSHFRRGEAITAIEFRCTLDNSSFFCHVPFKSVKNMGTRGNRRVYCGIGIPLTGKNKGRRLRYRAVVAIGKLPHARRVRSVCRR